ncbi:MAG: methyl-accepting chemotaxis protein [Bacteroidales bacterium]
MKIRLRLALSFGLILVFMIVIILVNLNQIRVSHDKLTEVIIINNVRIQIANNMIDAARESAIDIRNILLEKYQNQTSENIQKMIGDLTGHRKTYHEEATRLEALFPKEDTKGFDMLSQVNANSDTVQKLQDKVVELALAGKNKEGTDFMLKYAYTNLALWIKNVDDLITYNEDYNTSYYNEAEKAQATARALMTIFGIMAIVVSVVIAFFLTLSITGPLNLCVQAADMIASKDLTRDLSTFEKQGDEFGIMIQSFSKMGETLRGQMQAILDGVNVLASSSSEILASTTQIASGSAETAAAISETTTTVEEVCQAAQLSSQKAKNVSDNAQRVAQVSQSGQKAVDETVDGMNRIREQMDVIAQTVVRLSEQTQSIGGIIASVTDIADQSNLLAVNAAIEAAKAGEQGKGFAVVAQEIRNLAEQSKQSTNQVRNILNDVQKATSAAVLATEQGNKMVEAGVKQSVQAGEAIRVLAESSNEAVQATTQIVASSQQQLVGMDQIGTAMQNINQAGMETAASMTQAEDSVKNLHEVGQKLKELVEQFKM